MADIINSSELACLYFHFRQIKRGEDIEDSAIMSIMKEILVLFIKLYAFVKQK